MAGRAALLELLGLLPEVRVVVLLGRKAAQAWREAGSPLDVPTIEAPHPSPQVMNTTPAKRVELGVALAEAVRLARLV